MERGKVILPNTASKIILPNAIDGVLSYPSMDINASAFYTDEVMSELVRRFGNKSDDRPFKDPFGFYTSGVTSDRIGKYKDAIVKVRCTGLKAGLTCPWLCEECLAEGSELRYGNTYWKHVLDTFEALFYPDWYFDQFGSEISDAQLIRPFWSGDIPNQEFADRLVRFIKRFWYKSFFGYTKKADILDLSALFALKNANWVRSTFFGGERNFGPWEYAIRLSKKYGAPICPAYDRHGRVRDWVHCMNNCHACVVHEYIVFVTHP